MKIRRDNLIAIAGVVWIAAGINILVIGVSAYAASAALSWWAFGLMLLGSVFVFGLFHVMFGKLVKKHVARIRGLDDMLQNPLMFFDIKSYLVMAFMITLGVTLRLSGTVPEWFIASFYAGLGSALGLAGLGFLLHRIKGAGWSFHKGHGEKKAV